MKSTDEKEIIKKEIYEYNNKHFNTLEEAEKEKRKVYLIAFTEKTFYKLFGDWGTRVNITIVHDLHRYFISNIDKFKQLIKEIEDETNRQNKK